MLTTVECLSLLREYMRKNAAKYGFVVRYQEGKEKVTGYMPES